MAEFETICRIQLTKITKTLKQGSFQKGETQFITGSFSKIVWENE